MRMRAQFVGHERGHGGWDEEGGVRGRRGGPGGGLGGTRGDVWGAIPLTSALGGCGGRCMGVCLGVWVWVWVAQGGAARVQRKDGRGLAGRCLERTCCSDDDEVDRCLRRRWGCVHERSAPRPSAPMTGMGPTRAGHSVRPLAHPATHAAPPRARLELVEAAAGASRGAVRSPAQRSWASGWATPAGPVAMRPTRARASCCMGAGGIGGRRGSEGTRSRGEWRAPLFRYPLFRYPLAWA